MRSLFLFGALAGCLLGGCFIGPSMAEPIRVAVPSVDIAGKSLLVSEIKSSKRTVESRTFSAEITDILETATLLDAGPDVAQELGYEGVRATYRAGVSHDELGEDELLLTGNIVPRKGSMYEGTGGQILSNWIHILTGWFVAYLLPWPVPVYSFMVVEHDLRLLDREGTLIMRANGEIVFSLMHFVGLVGFATDQEWTYDKVMPYYMKELAKALAARLAPALAAARQIESPATP